MSRETRCAGNCERRTGGLRPVTSGMTTARSLMERGTALPFHPYASVILDVLLLPFLQRMSVRCDGLNGLRARILPSSALIFRGL